MKSLNLTNPLVMGVVNITPDSFFDGGSYLDADQAYAHLVELTTAGADIIDLGAMSSRPGHQQISYEEELQRLQPVLNLLRQRSPIPLSIDTDKPEVAAAALEAGAIIINSTSRQPSRQMAELAARSGAYLVIMFWGPFRSNNIIAELQEFFSAEIERAIAWGVSKDKLILDPGIGFEMEPSDCVAIIRDLVHFKSFGLPILVGMSNKRFVGAVSGAPLNKRLSANIAAELCAVHQGAAIIRVHNVEASVHALRMYQALKRGWE
jgi:dihydropteroate synthase